MWIAESERLKFRRITAADFEQIKAMLADPKVMYAWEHTFSDKQIEEWIAKQQNAYHQYGVGYFAAIDKRSNAFIGQIGLHHFSLHDVDGYEVCYMLQHKYFHKGYAAEGAEAMVNYAFDVMNLSDVYAQIKTDNYASVKVAERIGFTKQETFIKHYNGKDMPHYLYVKYRNNQK